LSGPLVVAFLYKALKLKSNLHFTYRFVFAPETIGTIAYLAENGQKLKNDLHAGYVVTCVGDDNKFTFKKSRKDKTVTNELTVHILKHHAKQGYHVEEFSPTGSDERQYCSPQFNLPVGSLMRTMYGKYKEYHTSLDNKDLISFKALEETVQMYLNLVEAFELNHYYLNIAGFGEPQLGKRNLYPDLGTKNQKSDSLKKILYILNYSDGSYSLLDIAEKLQCSILDLKNEVETLLASGLIIKQDNGI
jgi:aminopeptidase-like protein